MHDIWKHWTAVSTLLGLIHSVSRDLHTLEFEPASTDRSAETQQLSH